MVEGNESQHINESFTLPLEHHTLEFVVQHQDLDADAILRRGLELHRGHAERRVAVDVDDGLVRGADLGTDGRGETKAHRLLME